MNAKLLIIDDEESLRNSMRDYLVKEGCQVFIAKDGQEGWELTRQIQPDIVILDLQLPGMDGYEVFDNIKSEFGSAIGIIMISGSKTTPDDRVTGLISGADAYLVKPFETRELAAQCRALMRRIRAHKEIDTSGGWFVVDEYLRIHFEKRLVEAGQKKVHLTNQEFDLLQYLAERAGKPCSRADIIENVWKCDACETIFDGAVNTSITRLRSKIEPDPDHPKYILAERGYGYRFVEPED